MTISITVSEKGNVTVTVRKETLELACQFCQELNAASPAQLVYGTRAICHQVRYNPASAECHDCEIGKVIRSSGGEILV